MAKEQSRQQGSATVMRGADGSIYFIRDEVLQACKVPDDLAKEIEETLGQEEVRGFSLDTSQTLQPMGHVVGNLGSSARPARTSMCPGWITWGSTA